MNMKTTSRRKTTRRTEILVRLIDQQKWIDTHSATRAGYVRHYGTSGDGGEAIYQADVAQLHKLEDALRNAR
jgi:hypothetical protein